MRRLEPVLGWSSFVGLCLLWWFTVQPGTFWSWVGTVFFIVLSFGILWAIYDGAGYRIRGVFVPKIKPRNLKAVTRERLGLMQAALATRDLAILQGPFATDALNQLATMPASTIKALREGWFGEGSDAEVTGGVYAATVTVTSVARQLGDPVVKAKFKLTLLGEFPVCELKVSLTTAEETAQAVTRAGSGSEACEENRVSPIAEPMLRMAEESQVQRR